jgi:hypothetical protein
MPHDTILCWRTSLKPQGGHVTVADYKAWLAEGENGKRKIVQLVRERLRERYIDPINALDSDEKNGFTIMALSCLLVETLESFHQGWPQSPSSAYAFCSFFDREQRFHDFKGSARQFFTHVRCGILHQGETTGCWSITRAAGAPLFDGANLKVNATKFHTNLTECLDEYTDGLTKKKLVEPEWKKCLKKLNATVKQCG